MENKLNEKMEMEMEKGMIRNSDGCAGCALGAACLADGPVPDFEIAGLAGIFGIF